ncbi:uncharacterized protein [Dermacentor albipictus]|uniref:uncharacterized protein n=1 Tax=Dermacentor albipictus TaxID=60249 RepID=UPI0038FC072D
MDQEKATVLASTPASKAKGGKAVQGHESRRASRKKLSSHEIHHQRGHHRKRRTPDKGSPEGPQNEGKSKSHDVMPQDSNRRGKDKTTKSPVAASGSRIRQSKTAGLTAKAADRLKTSKLKNSTDSSKPPDAVTSDDPQSVRKSLPNVEDPQQPQQGKDIAPPRRAYVSIPAYLRNPWSSIAASFKPKDEQDFRLSYSKLGASIVIALATLLASALVASAMTWLLPTTTKAHNLLTPQMQSACTSDDCRAAISLLNLSVDSNASVCDDVYSFVCGRWKSTSNAGLAQSYYQTQLDYYGPLVHNALSAHKHANISIRSDVHQLIELYFSCLGFFSNRSTNLQQLWKAAGLNGEEWLHVTDFPKLINLIVRSAYKNRMPSMLHVELDTYGIKDAIVRTGRSLRTDAPVPGIVDRILERVPDGLIASSTKAELSGEFVRVEEKISNVTETWRDYDSALTVAATELDVPELGVTWAPLLNHTGLVRRIKCNSVDGVKSVLATLASTRLSVAALYALLVPFSALIGLDIRAAEHRGREDVATRRKICLGNVEFLLPRTIQRALHGVVDVKAVLLEAFLMCKRILVVSEHALTIARNVKLNMTLLRKACARGVYGMEEQIGAGEDELKTENVWHGGDFAANLVLYTGATGRAVDVSEMLVQDLRRRRFVPSAFMFPDFYYAHATEPSINYGTLGVFIAEMAVEFGMPKQRAPGYKECFAKYAKEQLDLAVELPDVDSLLRTSWAMNAAGAASTIDELDLFGTASKQRAQLFYLRFAHTYCGERDKSRLLALRYAAKTSPRFAEAFDCSKPKTVGC